VNRARVLAIARADLRQLRQSRDFWVPLAIIAMFMFLLVPTVLLYVISTVRDPQLLDKLAQIAGRLPVSVRVRIGPHRDAVQASYTLAVYLFAPLVTLVPLTVSSAVAANTFVGERERGSGEFLAHSPAATSEIFVGKLLAALVPGFVTAACGFVAYSAVVNLMLAPKTHGVRFPMGNWWVFVLWLVPALITLAVALIVTVSSRVSSGAAAQQASSLIALPLVVVAYAVSANAFFGSPTAAWVAGGVGWVAAALAIRHGTRTLRRERLLGVGG
jgi:ABC-type Na+ efflux pump permease subunit